MMKNIIKITAFSILLLASSQSYAEKLSFGLSAHGGLAGLGVAGLVNVNKNLVFRAGINKSEFSSDFNVDNVVYKANLNLDSTFALADWHPFSSSGLRLTAGVFLNGNSFTGSAKAKGSDFGGTGAAANANVEIDTKIEFPSTAPYIGIGWGNTNNGKTGLTLGVDVGVMLQGAPTATVTQKTSVNGLNLGQEAADVSSQLASFDTYPIIMVSLGFQF